MRHFPRLDRVAYGILRRRHPMVLTLLEHKDRVKRRLRRVSDRIPVHRAPPVIHCGSVSPIVGCVSAIVRRMPVSVSGNVPRKRRSIARRTVHHSAPLHLAGISPNPPQPGLRLCHARLPVHQPASAANWRHHSRGWHHWHGQHRGASTWPDRPWRAGPPAIRRPAIARNKPSGACDISSVADRCGQSGLIAPARQ